jgi:nitrous oxide reductase accessory protein NosL
MTRYPPGLLFAAGVALLAASGAALLLPQGSDVVRDADPVVDEMCVVAPATPYDPASGLDLLAPRAVPAGARCPVCGMYPARFPQWAAQAIFADGNAQFFDSPVNLFVFLGNVPRYNGSYAAADVAASYVTDYGTGLWIDAGQAFYVAGSDIPGPMRAGNLPAFAARSDAEAFAARHGGKAIARDAIDGALLRPLTHDRHHRH